MKAEELFDGVGFNGEYRSKMELFYNPYFDSKEVLVEFFYKIFKTEIEDSNFAPRRMMNQIQRFISLANDIDRIRSSVDTLKIIFLKTCLESLASLTGTDKKSFYKYFIDLISEQGKSYILNNIELIYLENKVNEIKYEYELSIEDFFEIIKAIRNMAVHDGICWETQLFSSDDAPLITIMTINQKIFQKFKYYPVGKCNFEYCFETSLNYEKFIFYFVDTCIRYLLKYIDNIYERRE